MFKALTGAWLLRRLVKELSGIRSALENQGAAVQRIAEKLDPTVPVDKTVLRGDTGVDHLDVNDAVLAQEYVARTTRDTGHVPDEDEVLIYLADEKTTELHKRLVERDEQLARLAAGRQ